VSIRARAAQDLQNILERDGDAFTITKPDESVLIGYGTAFRIDAQVDPDTDVQVYNPQFAVSSSLLTLGEEPQRGWEISAVDVLGNTVSGTIGEVRRDRGLGFVTIFIEGVIDA
jgi:hypothetical protein